MTQTQTQSPTTSRRNKRRLLLLPLALIGVAACGGGTSSEDAFINELTNGYGDCPAVGDTVSADFNGCYDEATKTVEWAVGVGNADVPGQCMIWFWGDSYWAIAPDGKVHDGEKPDLLDDDRCVERS